MGANREVQHYCRNAHECNDQVIVIVAGMGERPTWEALWFGAGAFGRQNSSLAHVTESWIHLLGDMDEGSSPAQFLQLSCSYVGTRGTDASKYVSDGMFHIPFEGHLHRLSL